MVSANSVTDWFMIQQSQDHDNAHMSKSATFNQGLGLLLPLISIIDLVEGGFLPGFLLMLNMDRFIN